MKQKSIALLEYEIEKTKSGVQVTHKGDIVHTAKNTENAQKWIQMQLGESFVDSALDQNYTTAEKQFKETMSEKCMKYMEDRKKEISKDFYK